MAENGNGQHAVSDRSVTHGDVYPASPGVGVFNFITPIYGGSYIIKNLPPDPPAYTPNNKYRDTVLSITPFVEGMWGNAIKIASSKIISREYEFEGPDAQIERMHDLWNSMDNGKGPAVFLTRVYRDFATTDNGAWIQIVRESDDPFSNIITLEHLDSLRCWRTGDPVTPIYYYDLHGIYHALKWYQCFNLVDQASPRAGFYNSGICAAARAFRSIRKLAGMDVYVDEKLTGGGYTEIEIVSLTRSQLENAIKSADSEAATKGMYYYKGKLIIPYESDVPLGKVTIPLKGVPDGFDREKEIDTALLVYAKSLGIVPQDLDPRLVARGAMGIGQQAQILDDNASGYGPGDFDKQLIHAMNELITPNRTTFSITVSDLRDDLQRAQVGLARAQKRQAQVTTGEITPQQSLQLAYDDGDVPAEFLAAPDLTIDNSISDEEKPDDVKIEEKPAEQTPAAETLPPEQVAQAQKEREFWQSLLAEVRAARREMQAAQEVETKHGLLATIKEMLKRDTPAPVAPQVIQPVINLPAMQPTINLPAATTQPTINLPGITVEMKEAQPIINVTTPQQPTPIVNVQPAITVAAPDVNITNEIKLPQKRGMRFETNALGQITSAVPIEQEEQ